MCIVQSAPKEISPGDESSSTAFGGILGWLSYASPADPKHHGYAHPLVYVSIHYAVVVTLAFAIHDWMVVTFTCEGMGFEQESLPACRPFQHSVAKFFGLYAASFLPWRLAFCPPSHPRTGIIYEMAWLCNTTLVLSALALIYNRPLICTACCVTVGIDQLLWYVDFLGYMVAGKFPVGVARYLTWPETSWATRVTCTHHIWTIPVLLTATGGQVPFLALPFSFVLMTANVCLSRMMTPPFLIREVTKDHTQTKYLNINLSHELWKDIKIKVLQINHGDPPAPLYVFRLLWRWQGFNTIVYFTLVLLCKFIFSGGNHICRP